MWLTTACALGAIFGALCALRDPIFGLAVLLPCALYLAVRAQRRRALGQLLTSAEFNAVVTDHGDHLRLACALHLAPTEPFRLRRWRVELVYADLEHTPYVSDLAHLGEEGPLDESVSLGAELALACLLPVPRTWIEHALHEPVGNSDVGWLVRVKLEFSPIDAWIGQTDSVAELSQLVTTVQ